jgi:gliding motility-associated-like protein
VDNSVNTSRDWFYYVKDSFACPGASYQIADTIQNQSNPDLPLLNYVTVNPDSSITFTWHPSTSPQTRFYILYIIEPNGNNVTIDTLFGRFDTTWTSYKYSTSLSSIAFSVAAGDSCPGNQLSGYNTSPQQTMLLKYSGAHCNPAIPLAWNKYINMHGGLGGYQIYVSRNDSAYVLSATVDSTTTTYNFLNFNNGDSLQIYIQAFNSDTSILSTSNYVRFIATVIKPPAFVYLTQLSVDTSNNQIDMTWVVDNLAKVFEYQVFNSQDGINYYTVEDANNGVEQVPVPVARYASYIDSTVQPQYQPYYYYVQAYDSCETSTSTTYGEIISLQGTLSDYYQITLSWNKFVLDSAHVIRYDLYRDIGTGLGMQFDRSFDSSTTTYIDSVFQDTATAGQFCYVIIGTYNLNLPAANLNAIETTFSNIACVDHRPIIYIPNAFVYNGVNNFFKPRIIFGDPAGYDMRIFDRYGGKIFETHDVNGSWDGTHDGHVVEQGGYAYLITFTALDGTPVTRSGIVMFLRK